MLHYDLIPIFNPRPACAARVMVVVPCVCVCQSVCVCEIWHYSHQAGLQAIPTASVRQVCENVCVASAILMAFDTEKPPGLKD